MPTKRRRTPALRIGISDAAAEAWKAGDFAALYHALDLRPFEPTPWPLKMTALGCDQGPCPDDAQGNVLWRFGWRRAQALQRALYAAAGEPGKMDRHGRPLGRRP